MTDTELKDLLTQTLELQRRNAVFDGRNADEGARRAPVSPEDLGLLEEHLQRMGARLPPSYRQLLHISDGVQGFMQFVELSLRSAREIVDLRESDEQWDDEAPLNDFVFASGETYEFVAFDWRQADAMGEAPVVWVDLRGDETRFDNFEAFVRAQWRFQQDVFQANQTDRAKLQDD